MADREFTDYGRPDLFNEEGEFLGSAADYDFWSCRVCGESFQGISAEDAAENHELWGEHTDGHEFELDTRCPDCGDETDEGECPNGCHEV